jgi:hypothetical protein
VIRRNVSINFEITIDKPQENEAWLDIKYSYDVYSIKLNSSQLTVEHDLLIQDPRAGFYEWSVVNANNRNVIDQYKWHDGEPRRSQFKADLHLEPGYDYRTNTFDETRAVHVVNKRKEVMNFPGIYSLGIPELIEGTNEHPLTVTVKVPEELE